MRKQRRAIVFSGIEKAIISVNDQNVIIDSDVAKIYGVETRAVNQAIKNNPDKFPAGYIIEADKDELIKNFDKFKNIKNYPGTPKAFTEKGLYMLATILKSTQATTATLAIIEAFAKLRELSHTIARLVDVKEKPKQQSLMQRSGEIFSELISGDIPVSETETTFEINFAVMKFRHTIKKGEKKATTTGAKKPMSTRRSIR
ncbi:MAG: ORF6N domain-containing protein [Treponema sp.]|jgi:phage regulator Rha-like protein|nr:ORF6N domain-containing protein [Treponema sp.]